MHNRVKYAHIVNLQKSNVRAKTFFRCTQTKINEIKLIRAEISMIKVINFVKNCMKN